MNRRRLIATTGVAAALVVLTSTAALARWGSTSTGSGTAKSTAMPTGGTPTSPVANAGTTVASIQVTWPVANYPTVTPTTAVGGYTVARYKGGVLDATGPSAGCAGIRSTLTCTDTVTVAGAYSYAVTPVSGTSGGYKGTEGPKSAVYNYTALSVDAPDLTDATDSGVSQTDNITNDTTPTFTVGATTGSSVQLFEGSTPISGVVNAAGGTATLTVTSALSGSAAGTPHTITAKATQSATTVTSTGIAVTIDTGGPTTTSYADTNGTNDGKFEVGDTFTATFSEAVYATWGTSATGTVKLADGNGNGGNPDTVDMDLMTTAASTLTRTDDITSNNSVATFVGTYTTPTSTTVKVTLGTCSGQCANVTTTSTAGNYGFTADSSIKDLAGNAATGTRTQSVKLF